MSIDTPEQLIGLAIDRIFDLAAEHREPRCHWGTGIWDTDDPCQRAQNVDTRYCDEHADWVAEANS